MVENKQERPVKSRHAEAIWAIVWNVIFLWIVNKVPDWNLAFITDKYDLVLWIFNLNILLQIGGYIIIFFFVTPWVWHLIRAILDGGSLIVMLVLFFLNPFDFSAIDGWTWLDTVLPITFIVGMIISGIGMVVHFFKLMFRLSK